MGEFLTVGAADEVAEGAAAAFEVEGPQIGGRARRGHAVRVQRRLHAPGLQPGHGRRARGHRDHVRVPRQHVLDRDRRGARRTGRRADRDLSGARGRRADPDRGLGAGRPHVRRRRRIARRRDRGGDAARRGVRRPARADRRRADPSLRTPRSVEGVPARRASRATSLLVRPADWWEAHGVEARFGVRAQPLDPSCADGHAADGQRIAFDRALVATGVRNRALRRARRRARRHLPAADGRPTPTRSIARPPARSEAVVVGMGFIGAEVAASLRQMGLEVTVVEIVRDRAVPHPGRPARRGARGDPPRPRRRVRLPGHGGAVRGLRPRRARRHPRRIDRSMPTSWSSASARSRTPR